MLGHWTTRDVLVSCFSLEVLWNSSEIHWLLMQHTVIPIPYPIKSMYCRQSIKCTGFYILFLSVKIVIFQTRNVYKYITIKLFTLVDKVSWTKNEIFVFLQHKKNLEIFFFYSCTALEHLAILWNCSVIFFKRW